MQNILFTGIATALITPFSSGAVDFSALDRLIEMQLLGGVSALVVCGTTGEAPTLSENEKADIVRYTVKKVNGRLPVIAGCGSPSTEYAARLASNAERAGADGILTVTPYYNKCTDEGLYLHYKTVAESVSLPVIAYNVPSRTGMDISLTAYEKLCKIENLIAIKEATGNVITAENAISRFKDRFAFYSGCDELIAPLCAIGAAGAISVVSNIMPHKTAELYFACSKGSVNEAAKLQLELFPIIKALFSEVNPIPVKTALSMMGICSPQMRLPLCAMTLQRKERLGALLSEAGVL